MNFSELDVVFLIDDVSEYGIAAGSRGTILEVYSDGEYEVEFSNDNGETIAMFALSQDKLSLSSHLKRAA